ncbi:hypothetical protein CRG98_006004 [Punica granatum]|uniref:DUF7755 domain-containing protein n=1 Tax=Punica granatum TaxID=22663 RepID=A0A2I0KZ73_PUNGR|nr:hypothetical protein CRG98_006004 [Punica granatum]
MGLESAHCIKICPIHTDSSALGGPLTHSGAMERRRTRSPSSPRVSFPVRCKPVTCTSQVGWNGDIVPRKRNRYGPLAELRLPAKEKPQSLLPWAEKLPMFQWAVAVSDCQLEALSALFSGNEIVKSPTDFQGYAKPSRLLPASEVKVSRGIPPDEKPIPSDKGHSQALFKIKIWTSRMYGSSLSNDNSGLLLCVIDENGDSILQRIPAITTSSSSSGENNESNTVHFQQGSDDEFTFEGPKLGRIQAVWISLESDEGHGGEEFQFTGFQYDFIAEDVLLGEGSDTSMVELRPSRVAELSGPDPFVLLSRNSQESTSALTSQTSNEESMREYADLKASLLLYDAALIVIGSSVLSLSLGENSALAFSIGGVGGLLYLLLLQRSVDELPSPASISRDSVGRVLGRFWGPISTVAVAVAFVLVALKYSSGENAVSFTPKELILGMMGFLTCKVAVVLAAFKPMTISWNRSTD